MNTTRYRSASVIVVGTVLLSSCSAFFAIKPAGQIDHGVTFTFFDTEAATKPSRRTIVEFVIEEQQQDQKWTIIWELVGPMK